MKRKLKDIMKQWKNEQKIKKNGMKNKWKKQQIEKLRQQLSDANADINRTNMSLKTLTEMNNHLKSLQQEYNTPKEPKVLNYYKPEEMKEYQLVVVSVIGIGGGLLLQKVFNF